MARKKQLFTLPPVPDLAAEDAARARGLTYVCGIDEAGRGPLAGPVVAAAVILPAHFELDGLHDSKKLSAKKREALFDAIDSHPEIRSCIASASVDEIDQLNILRATHLAMSRAALGLYEALGEIERNQFFCLIDGLAVPQFPFASENLVKGDARSRSIAAASILSKVSRDRYMNQLDDQYPQYGFAQHSGYGTAKHLHAIQIYGITPHHRRSFGPVAQTSLPLEF